MNTENLERYSRLSERFDGIREDVEKGRYGKLTDGVRRQYNRAQICIFRFNSCFNPAPSEYKDFNSHFTGVLNKLERVLEEK